MLPAERLYPKQCCSVAAPSVAVLVDCKGPSQLRGPAVGRIYSWRRAALSLSVSVWLPALDAAALGGERPWAFSTDIVACDSKRGRRALYWRPDVTQAEPLGKSAHALPVDEKAWVSQDSETLMWRTVSSSNPLTIA